VSTSLFARSYLSLVTPPAAEPLIVTVAEAKLQARVDQSAEDALITAYIQAARDSIENATGRGLVAQGWTQTRAAFPPDREPIAIYKGNLSADPTIQYRDSAGTLQTWDPANYVVARPQGPTAQATLIYPASVACYPRTADRPDAVIVSFQCGVAAGQVATLPAAYKLAMLLLVSHFYANRAATVAASMAELPMGVRFLLAPYEVVQLA
jgi:uncharacterized phiE125 gp8 family phage protein